MKKLLSMFVFCLFFVLGMIAMTLSSAAYIDPAATTFLISAITAAVVAGGAYLGYYFTKIKRAFTRNKDDAPVAPVQQDETIEDDGEFDDFDDQAEE